MTTQAQIQTARQEGYSDTEIAQFLAGSKYQEAISEGYNDQDIVSHYLGQSAQPSAMPSMGQVAKSVGSAMFPGVSAVATAAPSIAQYIATPPTPQSEGLPPEAQTNPGEFERGPNYPSSTFTNAPNLNWLGGAMGAPSLAGSVAKGLSVGAGGIGEDIGDMMGSIREAGSAPTPSGWTAGQIATHPDIAKSFPGYVTTSHPEIANAIRDSVDDPSLLESFKQPLRPFTGGSVTPQQATLADQQRVAIGQAVGKSVGDFNWAADKPFSAEAAKADLLGMMEKGPNGNVLDPSLNDTNASLSQAISQLEDFAGKNDDGTLKDIPWDKAAQFQQNLRKGINWNNPNLSDTSKGATIGASKMIGASIGGQAKEAGVDPGMLNQYVSRQQMYGQAASTSEALTRAANKTLGRTPGWYSGLQKGLGWAGAGAAAAVGGTGAAKVYRGLSQ